MEAAQYYPRTAKDVAKVLWLFRHHVHAGAIPEELIVEILDNAQYWLRSRTTRNDQIEVYDSDSDYLTTEPIVGRARKPVKRIDFSISANDQGWCSFPNGGTWTWFEVTIVKAGESNVEPVEFEGQERRLVTNSQAESTPQDHRITFQNGEHGWMDNLKKGDSVRLVAKARFGGWVNHVLSAQIDVYTSCLSG